MKKCALCVMGSWVVGLGALAWAAAAVMEVTPAWTPPVKGGAVLVGLTALGFLACQVKACPMCVKVNSVPGP